MRLWLPWSSELGDRITDYRIFWILLIPSDLRPSFSLIGEYRRFYILQDKDLGTRCCTNMGDKMGLGTGDIWHDYHEGWNIGDMCQSVPCLRQGASITALLMKEPQDYHFGSQLSNGDWLNLLLRTVMDWLLVNCNKQRYRGDRCGLVTIKIQKLYWSHYSQ